MSPPPGWWWRLARDCVLALAIVLVARIGFSIIQVWPAPGSGHTECVRVIPGVPGLDACRWRRERVGW